MEALHRILLLGVFLIAAMLGGCSQDGEVVSVLAGSELKDIEPMLDDIEREANVRIEFRYTGTLDGAETLASGEPYDMGWFSHAKYLALLEGRAQHKIIQAAEKLALSPVIAGVKKSVADRWGWCENPAVSWQAFADKASRGELTFAMTNPASSNSGFSATVGVQSALAGGEALQPEMIDSEAMLGFAKGHKLTSGSSGWLAEKYLAEQDRVDAIFNYESVLLGLNASGGLREPLCLIYPPEGVVTADYPLLLINRDKRPAFDRLVAYFKQPEVQARLMRETARRPVVPGVIPDARFPNAVIVELPFPGQVETVDQILMTYLDKQRAPSTSLFVLDMSGSMGREQRLEQLKQSLRNLAGADRSITGQFARFRAREQVIFQPFNDQPMPKITFAVQTGNDQDPGLQEMRQVISGFSAAGGTAIYDTLKVAYEEAVRLRAENPDRFFSIVLMSDGMNREGMGFADFKQHYQRVADEYGPIPTFPVIFGDANKAEMQALAQLTGGRSFDSTGHSLAQVFKKIRGYQ